MATATGTLSVQFPAFDLGGAAAETPDVARPEAVRRLAEAVGLARRTVLSPHQAEVQLAREALEALGPAVRAEMVGRLREQVQLGTYRPDPQAIAAKLVPHPSRHSPGSHHGNGVCAAGEGPALWPRAAALGRRLQAWWAAYRYVRCLDRADRATRP